MYVVDVVTYHAVVVIVVVDTVVVIDAWTLACGFLPMELFSTTSKKKTREHQIRSCLLLVPATISNNLELPHAYSNSNSSGSGSNSNCSCCVCDEPS